MTTANGNGAAMVGAPPLGSRGACDDGSGTPLTLISDVT